MIDLPNYIRARRAAACTPQMLAGRYRTPNYWLHARGLVVDHESLLANLAREEVADLQIDDTLNHLLEQLCPA